MNPGDVVRIKRYGTIAVWEKEADGTWDLGCEDTGTHFHLFDSAGHEVKMWGRDLPPELERVVYPGNKVKS